MKNLIKKEIEIVIKNLYNKEIFNPELGQRTLFDVSAAGEHADYASNVAMVLKDLLVDGPRETAEKIQEELSKSNEFNKHVEKTEIAGPGFINFWLKDEIVWGESQKAEKAPKNKKPRTIVVEYGQENIAKPMSVGHLRSNIIGQSLVNIFKFLGENVITDNHLGDWGTQFGKLIVAYKKWGEKEKIEKNPITELNALYVRFHKEVEEDVSKVCEMEDEARLEFKKLEDGDEENTKLWEWFKGESLKEFEKMYKRLGTSFDYMHGEAFYKNDTKTVIDELITKEIAVKNEDSSIMVEFPEAFSPSPLLIQKSDGATLYATRDLAAIKFYKSEFKPDLVLQCVGSEQGHYFKQVYNTAQRAGWIIPGEFVHIQNGMVRLPEGKMSTRKGNTVRLENLLDEAEEKIENILVEKNSSIEGQEKKELAKILGVGAVKFADLGQNRESNIVFTWDKMLSLDGYSAPYLQYTYSRANSILRKAEGSIKNVEFKEFNDVLERKLALKLSFFMESVKQASDSFHPHMIAQYLFDLAQLYNKFYQALPVMNAEKKEEKDFRLVLTQKTTQILKTGLSLLGISVPERM